MNTEFAVNSSTTENENELSPLQPRRLSPAPSDSLYTVESPNGQILDSFDSKDYDSYKSFVLSTDAVNYNEDSHQDDSTPVSRRLHRNVVRIFFLQRMHEILLSSFVHLRKDIGGQNDESLKF